MRGEKYISYIDIFEDFFPVYDIENEVKNYWKQFIPTNDFLAILSKFISSLEATSFANKKSIIIQGRYGTGKSHATGVIKHLLWDPYEEIEDFINKINDSQIREKIRNYRIKNRILPVTIKSISTVFEHKSLVLTIEKAVKKALSKENININIKSDFDKYIESIEKEKFINWDEFIESNPKVKALVYNKEGLIRELKAGNIDVLKTLEECFPYQIPVESIEDWLTNVSQELKKNNISGMCIYWDEFTSILELPQSGVLLSVFQNIAEKTPYNNVYLFIVTHRHPHQTSYTKEDYEKVLGRFEYQEYKMEEITTFHIMSNIIKKKDIEKWEEEKDKIFKDYRLSTLIFELTDGNPSQKEAIKNIFPVHPYTAYLATKLADYIGSAQRSIFSFFHDKEKGFVRFIKDYPQEDSLGDYYFLTADFLWDFFYDDFIKNSDIRSQTVLEKAIHMSDLKKHGKHYEAIYKGILLLNLITSFISLGRGKEELYTPSEKNIKRMFLGTCYENYVDEVLNYINNNGYITKTPDDLFLISLTPLPQREVDIEKDNFRKEYINNILKSFSKEHEEKIEKIFKDNVLRPVKVCLFDATTKDFEIKKKLRYTFEDNYFLNVAVFLSRLNSDIKEGLNTIEKLRKEDDSYRNIVFIICDEALGERSFNDLIEYRARAVVADKHDFKNEREISLNYSRDIINKWIERIEKGTGRLIYLDKSELIHIKNFSNEVNDEISINLFKFGPENIQELCNNINIWKKQQSEKPAEIFLYAENFRNLEDLAKNQPYKSLLSILKTNEGEYIVDNNLKIKEGVDPDHPTVKLCKEIERRIKEKEGQSFNLADTLSFVFKSPFGIFPSMIGSAMIAFALKTFVDRLYEERTGIRIDKVRMKEKVMSLLKYIDREEKERDKLYVRLGTLEEKELGDILKELFDLERNEGLNQIRWEIRGWIKTKGRYPIWSLKNIGDIDVSLIEKFIKAINFLISSPDRELKQETINYIISLLKNYKTDLKINLKPERLEKGFKRWVEEKIGSSISEEEMKDLMSYLYSNIQEEVSLWDESKVEAKLADWKKDKMKKIIEKDFINTLSNIFNLSGVSNLSELKERIIEKINKDIGYPLWIFNYLFNNESIKKIFQDIEDFINTGSKISEDTMKDITDNLKSFETLLIKNLNSDFGRESLNMWLKNKKVSNSDKCIEFIKENMKKDPYLWKKEDLEEWVIKYQFINYLADVMGIKVDNEPTFKNNIKIWMGKLDYPFWAFSSQDNPNSEKIINSIIDYVSSSYSLPMNFYEEILRDLENYKDNIGDLFDVKIAKNNLKTLIKNITESKEEDIDDNIFKEILDDIHMNMKIEEYHWNKQAVENYILKNIKKYSNKINEKRKDRVKNKINSTNKDLKEILIRLIDEEPSICKFIEKMLD
ncbi:MAG: hypothetical protein ABDH25_01435 [Dictyoglomaceae bacterium]